MDGAAVEGVVRIAVAADLQAGNFNHSRLFYMREDGSWYHWDVQTVVVSICVAAAPRRTFFALGRDGLISGLVSGGDFFTERIEKAGTGRGLLGYLSQIRIIAGDIYACGDGAQVLQRTPKGWRSLASFSSPAAEE